MSGAGSFDWQGWATDAEQQQQPETEEQRQRRALIKARTKKERKLKKQQQTLLNMFESKKKDAIVIDDDGEEEEAAPLTRQQQKAKAGSPTKKPDVVKKAASGKQQEVKEGSSWAEAIVFDDDDENETGVYQQQQARAGPSRRAAVVKNEEEEAASVRQQKLAFQSSKSGIINAESSESPTVKPQQQRVQATASKKSPAAAEDVKVPARTHPAKVATIVDAEEELGDEHVKQEEEADSSAGAAFAGWDEPTDEQRGQAGLSEDAAIDVDAVPEDEHSEYHQHEVEPKKEDEVEIVPIPMTPREESAQPVDCAKAMFEAGVTDVAYITLQLYKDTGNLYDLRRLLIKSISALFCPTITAGYIIELGQAMRVATACEAADGEKCKKRGNRGATPRRHQSDLQSVP